MLLMISSSGMGPAGTGDGCCDDIGADGRDEVSRCEIVIGGKLRVSLRKSGGCGGEEKFLVCC